MDAPAGTVEPQSHARTLVAFVGDRRISSGPISDVLTHLKGRFDRGEDEALCFDVRSGAQVEFNLRGPLEQVLERAAPTEQRGRGRPRLGVTSREVSLMPRHWEWLEQQPSGASAALRRLVEQASKADPGREQAKRIRGALSRVLTALAGNRANYEEACRALFAAEDDRFASLAAAWPADIQAYAVHQAREATRLERASHTGATSNATLVRDLYDRVWSFGDYDAIEPLVAQAYTIHADPGDAWEGQSLTHDEYRERVRYSRNAFPDLTFTLDAVIADGDRVAVRWRAEGTHDGDLRGLPATGKRLGFAGQTIYEIAKGHVAGHWQVIDRLGFVAQLRS